MMTMKQNQEGKMVPNIVHQLPIANKTSPTVSIIVSSYLDNGDGFQAWHQLRYPLRQASSCLHSSCFLHNCVYTFSSLCFSRQKTRILWKSEPFDSRALLTSWYFTRCLILQVNVSMIGHVNVSFNTSTGSIFKRELSFWDEAEEKLNEAKDILEYFAEQGNKAVDSIREQGTQILQNVTNEAVGFVAETLIQALNLHDFYSAHILTYCEVGGSLYFPPLADLPSDSCHDQLVICKPG